MRGIVLLVAAVIGLWLFYRFVILQPSNQRGWEYGMQILPHVTGHDNVVSVDHIRDFHWAPDGSSESAFVDRSFDITQLEHVWFVEEPFTIPPFDAFSGVAHTYFVFDFKDQPPVAISVEARRERGKPCRHKGTTGITPGDPCCSGPRRSARSSWRYAIAHEAGPIFNYSGGGARAASPRCRRQHVRGAAEAGVIHGRELHGLSLANIRSARSALTRKPAMLGDSYHAACERRASNSARLSPPVLPMMLL